MYKSIFGNPNEGVHKYRIFNIAIIDAVFTVIGSYLIARLFNYSFIRTLITIFIIGIIAHKMFCVKTTIDKILFL